MGNRRCRGLNFFRLPAKRHVANIPLPIATCPEPNRARTAGCNGSTAPCKFLRTSRAVATLHSRTAATECLPGHSMGWEHMQDIVVSEVADGALNAPAKSTRVASLDMVRGIAMILMAIDHVRVYSGLPAGGATFGIFFTRWITNFVAPTFVFLAGVSAYLYGRKCLDRASLSRFLAASGWSFWN